MKKLNLTKELFLYYYDQNLSDKEIADILNVSRKTIGNLRNKFNLIPNKRIVTIKNEDIIMKLCNENKNDREISELLGISRTAVQNFRKRHHLKSACYSQNTNCDVVIKRLLFDNGYSEDDFVRLNIRKQSNILEKDINVIVGIMMGDGSMQITKGGKNACFYTAHGQKQSLYSLHIANRLIDSGAKFGFSMRHSVDERTNVAYLTYWVRIGSNERLNILYEKFYPNGKKHIPLDLLLQYYNEESLAYHFMDDGYKISGTYGLCTLCFDKNELESFINFLYDRFCIYCTIQSDNRIYIRKICSERFKNLVSPYICESMSYKLQSL